VLEIKAFGRVGGEEKKKPSVKKSTYNPHKKGRRIFSHLRKIGEGLFLKTATQ
jgi:hypothetical protein